MGHRPKRSAALDPRTGKVTLIHSTTLFLVLFACFAVQKMITEKRPSKPSLRQAQNTASATQTVTPSADSWWLSSPVLFGAYRNHSRLTQDGVDIIPVGYAWLDKEKLLPGQDWELEIRKAVQIKSLAVLSVSDYLTSAKQGFGF